MGPLFSLVLIAAGCAIYAALVYAVLKISHKYSASLFNVAAAIFGAFLGIAFVLLFSYIFLNKSVETTIGVLIYLTLSIVLVLLTSFLGLKFLGRSRAPQSISLPK